MRQEILRLLRKAGDHYLSGEEIAETLGVSRTAIWKHIKELRRAGYDIVSQAHSGYRLEKSPDLLTPAEIAPLLKTRVIGAKLLYKEETRSTNEDAKIAAAEGAPDGTVVLTEFQGTGHGRLSRGWFCPKGKGVLFSVLLRPQDILPQDAPKYTLLAAVAVVRVCRARGLDVGIKWPNDVLADGKKLVGILTEMSAEMERIHYIVIGTGINVNIEAAEFAPEIREKATSLSLLAGHPLDRRQLLADILQEMETLSLDVQAQGFVPVLDEWRRLSLTLGQEVRVIGVNETFTGRAVDIDADGALLVDTETGRRRVLAADVSIRPADARQGR
ncbi:biotin--[acetyl-CoA-carboxylase] ligase [uncultured Selenomonas sp.]|uniref:biotin--[acetyl-CoA-carboxylase] ligase n=1 Tax=uncultured Selenomonas sp. TaxID=159275 RepID=UPI0028058762|nr:biotin--[acetyl-CoA-carboxylase] ligase [uncultured Selenomonas sp.]